LILSKFLIYLFDFFFLRKYGACMIHGPFRPLR
jgi:hypothetical protein